MRAAWRGWCGRNWWQRDRTSRRIGQGASGQGQDRCGVLAWLPVEECTGGAGRRRRCAAMEAAGVTGGNTARPRAEVARRGQRWWWHTRAKAMAWEGVHAWEER